MTLLAMEPFKKKFKHQQEVEEFIPGNRIIYTPKTKKFVIEDQDYSTTTVKFFLGDDEVNHVHSWFLSRRILFENVAFSGKCVHVKRPTFTTADVSDQKRLDFLWRFNFEENTWITSCPRVVLDEIFEELGKKDTRCDEMCLKGFSYVGKWGNQHTTKLSKIQIEELCACMNQEGDRAILRAADLLNNRFWGHVTNSDTAINNESYVDDKVAYDTLVRFELMSKDRLESGDVFLRLPSIKNADETLKEVFEIVQHRFQETKSQVFRTVDNPVGEVLCEEQICAVETSIKNGVSYITGSAGRGKSSAIMEIIRRSSSTIICTPTHAARKVIQKRIEKNCLQDFCRADVGAYIKGCAKNYDGGVRECDKPLLHREMTLFELAIDPDIGIETLVMEESSMIDVASAADILQSMVYAFPDLRRIVFVGDTKQLQSIGKGNMLDDLIESESIPGSTLCINHRSGSLSHNIDCILEGRTGDIILENKKFEIKYIDEVETEVDEFDRCLNYVTKNVVDEMIRSKKLLGYQTHTLCYTHDEVDRVNSWVAKKPGGVGPMSCMKKGYKVRVKNPDKVVGKVVYRNDILSVVESNVDESGNIDLAVKEWKRTRSTKSPVFNVCVKKNNLNSAFEAGYATTMHSFQGDESDAIVIHAVQNCKYFDRLALYTAASRARNLIVLVTVRGRRGWESIVESLNPKRVSCLKHTLDDDFLLEEQN